MSNQTITHAGQCPAHESSEYDRWFQDQVQEAIDDPRPAIPHKEAMARVEKELERLIGPRSA